jgi:hypothetical protein
MVDWHQSRGRRTGETIERLFFDLAINSYPVQYDATLILYSPSKTIEMPLNTESVLIRINSMERY